jgi:hypothetical protein
MDNVDATRSDPTLRIERLPLGTSAEKLTDLFQRLGITHAEPALLNGEVAMVNSIAMGSQHDTNAGAGDRYGQPAGTGEARADASQLTEVERAMADLLQEQLRLNEGNETPIIALDSGIGINKSWSVLSHQPELQEAVKQGRLVFVGLGLSERTRVQGNVIHLGGNIFDLLDERATVQVGDRKVPFRDNVALLMDNKGPLKHSFLPVQVAETYAQLLRQGGVALVDSGARFEGSHGTFWGRSSDPRIQNAGYWRDRSQRKEWPKRLNELLPTAPSPQIPGYALHRKG